MKINVSAIRSHYPEALGIRMGLQKLKVKRITRHMLTEKDIELCESDPSKKEAIIHPYLKKWEKYLKPCITEMQTMVVKSPIFNGGGTTQIQFRQIFCSADWRMDLFRQSI